MSTETANLIVACASLVVMVVTLIVACATLSFMVKNSKGYLRRKLREKERRYNSFYYGTITPSVIQRNVFENAGWYTAYTPYQTEISQGRLEALMTYQTMVADMTHMPMANASLLDEATAGGECMLMFFASRSRQAQKDGVNKIFVDNGILPQTLDVMHTNAAPRNIEIVTGNVKDFDFDATKYFGVVVQNPNQFGEVCDYTEFIAKCHEKGIWEEPCMPTCGLN